MSQLRPSPSKGNLLLAKGKLKSAQLGYSLLDKKAKALKKKFRVIMKALIDAKKDMGEQSRNAFLSLAKAQHAAGDINPKVQNSVKHASIKIGTTSENIAGVEIPNLVLKDNKND